MNAHTPGPWNAIDNMIEPSIGVAYGLTDGRANALLIAAAPELLEALQAFVARNSSEEYVSIRVPSAAVTRARAAIAKAEGRAPLSPEGQQERDDKILADARREGIEERRDRDEREGRA